MTDQPSALPPLPPVAAVTGIHSEQGAQLREAFSRSLTRSPAGAQLVVTRHGEVVVDIAGGPVLGGPPAVDGDTLVQVHSVSKFVAALAAAHAHEAGVLDLDAPVASYWPAFDRDSTRSLTARHVLDHSSGISAVERPLLADELLAGALDEAVAVQEPFWAPGTEQGIAPFDSVLGRSLWMQVRRDFQ